MGKCLVIVESPAKAKTINKYLGKDFIVKSSVGHVRDLPTAGSSKSSGKKAAPAAKTGLTAKQKEKLKKQKEQQALINKMGIDPYHGWQANYQILPGKEKVVAELKSLAEQADLIYLATDLDREGEAIAWHLRELIGGDEQRFKRVVFNEITKNAIQKAFEAPGELNMDGVHAQQARRFLDRVVGFMVSPLLWKKLARGLSAGRVQSVAVKLLVEREHEIKAFVPAEFWSIHADVQTQQAMLRLELSKYQQQDFKAVNQTQADTAVAALQRSVFEVVEREDRPTSSKASAPFITSTLQQAASTRLGFGVKKTMMLAQRLYEAGYITYMRTDSTNLSQEAVAAVREFILAQYGQPYLPEKPLAYSAKANAQEAHEAIRPSSIEVTTDTLVGMEDDAHKLYELIWRQFVACQMTAAKYDSSTIKVQAGDYQLKAKGRILRFDGWTKVQRPLGKNEDVILPQVQVGETLSLISLDPKQHFTKPPARFTEAALIKELEKRAIGRPSTYASIISTIQDRGYVRVEQRRFYAEKMGEIVTDRLNDSFSDLMDYAFTARMEERLDDIAEGKKNWQQVLDTFFADFTKELAHAELDESEGGMQPNSMVMTDIKCPTCGRDMGIRTASTGVFLGCSGYALPPKERCKTTINLMDEEGVVNVLEEDIETAALRAKKRCPVCETAMDAYLIDQERKLHVCGNNPTCPGYVVEQGEFKLKGYDGPVITCDKCGSDMVLKEGRFGKYMACTNENCKNTRKILKNGDIAPPKEDPIDFPELPCEKSDAHFVLRDGASGLFFAASNFPKSRETRAPLVEELARFKQRLPEKFAYLAEAPAKDDEGRPAVVRFDRKEKVHYVRSENDGKPSGWKADYIDGKWQISQKKKK